MADIAHQVRSRNSHDPNHLTFGHFGTPAYDDSAEQWKFLRHTVFEGEGGDSETSVRLILKPLHSQIIPAIDSASYSLLTTNPALEHATRARHSLGRQYAVRFALDSVPRDALTTPPDSGSRKENSAASLAFGYASAQYEAARHGVTLPILVSVQSNQQSLRVNFVKSTEIKGTRQHPLGLENQHASVPVPCDQAIFGLCFSADKRYLAVRQTSGTSIVIPVYGGTDPADQGAASHSIHLESIVTLPRTSTGGFPHADVAFHPKNQHLIGVVDTHGNWSAWHWQGRRSSSSRVLYRIKVHGSGKLVPSETSLKHFGKDLYLDGWHRICCLERSRDIKAFLVCSRRVACTFNLDGSTRGDVDMRLGNFAARNWILDIQTSAYQPAVCYVLTSTRVQVMRLSASKKRTDELEMLCSWAHFRGRADLSLTLNVVEISLVTCLSISSNEVQEVWTYWIHWSDEGTLLHTSDPQLLGQPLDQPQQIERPLGAKFEMLRVDSHSTSKDRASSQLLVDFVRVYTDGNLYNTVYSFAEALCPKKASIDARSALTIPPAKERRIKSSRVVEEEDDFLDFIVPDDLPRACLHRHIKLPNTKSANSVTKTRDWSDIMNLQSGSKSKETVQDAIHDLDNAQDESSQDRFDLQTLAEVLPGVRIPDIEEAASVLSALEHAQHANSDHDGLTSHIWRNALPQAGTILDRYASATARYLMPLSAEVPERVKVQTERLCRNVAFDEYTSHLVKQHQRTQEVTKQFSAMKTPRAHSSPLSSPPSTMSLPNGYVDPVWAILKRYTSVSAATSASLSSSRAREILAHLPNDELLDPQTYSYSAVEDRLRWDQAQQEMNDLDERTKRKAERSGLREERRKIRQAKMRDAVTQQSTLLPRLVLSSPQRDPREVQSSQLAPLTIGSSQPGLIMTQPERGTHGERPRVVKKEGKHRVKGF